MKKLFAATAVLLATASLVPAMVAPAEAVVITKRVVVHRGIFGHGCRTVTTTRRGMMGTARVTRRVCN